MTRLDLVLRGARVLTDAALAPRTVGVRDGRVAVVADGWVDLDAARTVELADDEVLAPGLVDTHVHVNEPGRTDWEGFDTATRAAAAGGVTTILDMPLNSVPATVDVEALHVKQAAARGQCHVDVGFWGGAVPASLGRLEELHEAGVLGFKCFLLDSGVPEFPPLDADQLERTMTEIATFDGLLIVHAEDGPTIEAAASGPGPHYVDFLRGRPPRSEHLAVRQVVEAARRTGARAHVVHLSSAGSVPVLRAARAEGVRVTAETCPHYLTLNAEDVPDGQTQFKCCPPIRDLRNQDLLWEALVEGVVDQVVTDHSPSTPSLKSLDTGDFDSAWGGISGLQLGLAATWTEARRRGVPLEQVLGWMSGAPARLVGLTGKGSITVGADADLAVLAPDASFVVDPAALAHRHPLTPYAGRTLSGVVRTTYLRGQPVTGSAPSGRLLTRPPREDR